MLLILTAVKDKLKLKSQVCFPVYALAREIISHYRPLLEELELTYPQYLVMLVLWEEGEQTVNQLGAKLKLDSGTLTPLLKRLEQKGFVARTRSSSDERVVHVSLLEKGEKLKTKASCIPERLKDSLNISMEDLATLKHIVDKILNRTVKH